MLSTLFFLLVAHVAASIFATKGSSLAIDHDLAEVLGGRACSSVGGFD